MAVFYGNGDTRRTIGLDRTRSREGLLERWLPSLGALMLRLHAGTLRFREEGKEVVRDVLATGRPVLLVSWHGRIMLLAYHMRDLLQVIMISRSRDGQRIAAISERIGIGSVRGSSSCAGARALLELVRRLQPGTVGGHIVDGPLGPAGEIKPGLLLAAQRSGASIVPVYASAKRRWEARSWDRMQIAWPFTCVRVRYGTPVDVPAELDSETFERLRLDLEEQMQVQYARLEGDLAARMGMDRIE